MASNGEESEFFYGIKNNASIENATPTLIVTKNADGTYEHATVANIPLSAASIAALALKNNLIDHLEFNDTDKTVWNKGKSNVQTATSYGDGAGRLATGIEWTANGYQAGYSVTSGTGWNAYGYQAGFSNTTGNNWLANGSQAGFSNITGDSWTANGVQAGFSNTSGSGWTANGVQAGFSNTNGNNWTANGYQAGYAITTGDDWVANGVEAARYIADGTTPLLTVNKGLFLGANTKALADNSINETVIGATAVGLGSNTTVVGNLSTIFGRFWGRLLLGKSTDNGVDDLQVNGTVSAAPATLSNQVVVKSQLDLKANIAAPTFTTSVAVQDGAGRYIFKNAAGTIIGFLEHDEGTLLINSGLADIQLSNSTTVLSSGDAENPTFFKVEDLASGVEKNALINADGIIIAGLPVPKVYNALLNQSALLPPVATIVSNTLSGTPAWAYVSPGQYTLTLANAFPLGKTLIFSLIGSGTAAGDTSIKCFRNTDSEIVLNTTFNAAFTNILLTNASFKIEVYP
jgi:hypothetical protein